MRIFITNNFAIEQYTFVASVSYPTGSTSVCACSIDLVTAFFIVTVTAFGVTAWTIPTSLTALKTETKGNCIVTW